MSDLISKSALIKALSRNSIVEKVYIGEKSVLDVVKEQPTIEAVPIEEVLKVVKEVYHNFSGYDLEHMTKYGNETVAQQRKSYSSLFMYEIAMEFDDLIDRLESMKGGAENV